MGNTEASLSSKRSKFFKGQTDPRDADTPDAWIKRDPMLERLTGNHPLNAEMPLSLVARTFKTEPSQAYVRNHGAVPKLDRETHRLEIKGLGLSDAISLSMDELESFPSKDVAVTFCCSGNRRKEINAVKPSIGVPYGPGAVQTGVFTGIPLLELMRHVGFNRKEAHKQMTSSAASGLSSPSTSPTSSSSSSSDIDEKEEGKETGEGVKGEGEREKRGEEEDVEGESNGKDKVAFINFSGPATELPKGGYGTSLLLDYALDPTNDVIIAYKVNGQPLLPDHGFPLRLIIPGYIGGRMIKWLKTIEVSPHESQSHYYFHDNRLFPSTVGYQEAFKGKWWYKPEYIIGEMNLNSAITEPPHGYILPLDGADDNQTIRGFAYSGGGRRIVIVELSFDNGQKWEIADLYDHELGQPNSAGKFWTWRLWSFEIDLSRLLTCKNMQVRAWDSSFHTQPQDISWNMLGMMNNSRYVVEHAGVDEQRPITIDIDKYKVGVESCRTQDGRLAISFTHPQPPHDINYDKSFGRPPCEVEERERPQVPPHPSAGKQGKFTKKEVARHSTEDDLWLIVKDQVYNVTTFLKDHPGGAGIISSNGGQPCLEFDDIHSKHAHTMLKEYWVGELADEGEDEEEEEAPPGEGQAEAEEKKKRDKQEGKEDEEELHGAEDGETTKPFLDPRTFKASPLLSKKDVSHDTRLFRFGLSHPDQELGLPIGQHIYLRARIHEKMILRPYTPTSLTDERGYFDLIVKVYAAGQDPKHPEGGKMSQYLDKMSIGDTIDVKGPMGRLVYKSKGWLEIMTKPRHASKIGMVAGGTGITPMYQVIKSVLRDRYDPTSVSLVFANKSPDDILLRNELDGLSEEFPDRFKVWYTVDRVPVEHGDGDWPYDIGHVNEDMLEAHLPPAGADTIALFCGPPPLVQYACRPNLEKLGYTEDMMFDF